MKVNMHPECNPWVYCTSHMSSQSELRNLRAKFRNEYDYDTSVEIKDAYAFAIRLGIDFALQINKRKCLKLNVLDRFIYPNATYITAPFITKTSLAS